MIIFWTVIGMIYVDVVGFIALAFTFVVISISVAHDAN